MVVPCSGALLLVILAAVRGLSEAHCSLMTHRGSWMWSHICGSWGAGLLCVVCCVAVGGLCCRGSGSDFVFVCVGVLELLEGCDMAAESGCVESGSGSSGRPSRRGSGSFGGGADAGSSTSVSKPIVVPPESALSWICVGDLVLGLGMGS